MYDDFKPQLLKDAVSTFEAGINEGISPLLLQKNQLAGATNLTVRGAYAQPRPATLELGLDFGGNVGLQNSVLRGLFQAAAYYKPDAGPEALVAAIAGNLYQFVIGDTTATVTKVNNGAGLNQDPTTPQHFLWQSELYIIWNDGINSPIFYTSNPAAPWVVHRSNFQTKLNYGAFNTTAFAIPAVGQNTVAITFNDVTNLLVGDVVTLANKGQFQVQTIGTPGPADVVLLNLSATPAGQNVAISGSQNLFWSHIGQQLPPGRMGAYGMGRNWVSLIDGKQFVASDIEGGASGTAALNYRDSVLSITENDFLVGGGNFSVPGSIGEITAMRFGATLDASLGQGPLQVFTADSVFSVNTPVDRTTWQSVTNPILTESLIGGGALNQDGTILANGDFLFRSEDGSRSLILARRDFDTWGNVPQSREVDPILSADNPALLKFGSAVIFDNRFLMTANPVQADQGVYHRKLIALNFDPISSLRGKAPSVYDGQWIGRNILKLVVGRFGGVQRCFAFTLNTVTNTLGLIEITKSPNLTQNPSTQPYPLYEDNNSESPIVYSLETASLFNRNQADPTNERLKRLLDGEIVVDNLIGRVWFQTFWKPDQWPCWVPWHAWSECSDPKSTSITKPGFRPRMGLGEPSATFCDESNDRPLREFYTMQFKITIVGHCRLLAARFKAVTVPQEQFAKPVCCPFNALPPPPLRTTIVIGDTSGNIVSDSGGDLLGG